MTKVRIVSSSDCKDSEFSTYDKEEEARSIEHVVDVSGDENGAPLEGSDRPYVTLEGTIKGTPEEYETKTRIEKCLGPFVAYAWNGNEKPERTLQRNIQTGNSKQQPLAKYFS